MDKAEERQAAWIGDYMIEYTDQEILDCYSSIREGRCKVSYSESPLRCTNGVNPDEIVNTTCDITRNYVNSKNTLRFLVASIHPHIKLLWKYGVKFRFG